MNPPESGWHRLSPWRVLAWAFVGFLILPYGDELFPGDASPEFYVELEERWDDE